MYFIFSTAVRVIVVAKLVMLVISPLTSFILALKVILVTNLVMTGMSSSILF